MTSTTDTAGHPEVTEISDLSEGLLPPSRTADVRQHLDECPLCSDVYASLEEIRGLLGTLPGPPRMPDDVAGRIDAALAAEALLNATGPASETPDELAAASRTAASENDAHVSRETSSRVDDRPAGRPRASTGPGRTSQKRRSRRRTAIGAVFAIAALGFGAVLVQSLRDDDSPPASASDTFSGVKLEKRVEDLLTKTESGSTGGKEPFGTATAPDKGTKTFFAPDVPDCIAKGIGDTTGAIASEPGTYQGADAYLVLLPDRSDDARVTAYVVDASCLKKASEPVGDVLVKHAYARP
ncbi:anti-sigma factor family protein [Streptomyces sp. FxanaA7]|uniref:anti-sigma factor family protein n=1 Tax=Streptomyces sp. FxanaA7 TaxID=1265492 RepID=UPI0005EF2DFB|nr:membrane protein [Streptomyces sp. FxanaA7]